MTASSNRQKQNFFLRYKLVKGQIKASNALRILPYSIAAILTGLVSVGYTKAFEFTQEKSHYILANFPLFFPLLTPIAFVAGWWLVNRYAPGASGSGIPQVMAILEKNPKDHDGQFKRLVGLRIVVVKFFSSLLCVFGGGAVGREGPTIQIAASIFYTFGKRFRTLTTTAQHHSWIIAGSASGLAAAFNTPLGGLVFAIEELTSPHFRRLKTTLISAVIIAGMVAQSIYGPYLYFGFPKIQMVTWHSAPYALLVGIVVGFLGAVFGLLLSRGMSLLRQLPVKRRFLTVIACGLAVSFIGLIAGESALGGGTDVVRQLLFQDEFKGSWGLAISRFFTTLFSYFSGCAGGVFAPSLALGASFGSLLSGILDIGNPNLIILLGMAAFLAGVTDAPFTSFVLIVEMTDRHSAIFLIMLAAIAAATVSRAINKESFYRAQMQYFLSWFRSIDDELAQKNSSASSTESSAEKK
ncbi:MAG: chloride channel protein [Oligoflexus sp.]